MSDELVQGRTKFDSKEAAALIIGFLAVSAVFVAIIYIAKSIGMEIGLPTLSITGIVLLLFCLAAIAYVFVRAGLQDPSQALGLPAGSIQAVIALALIVQFAILSIFIFASMSQSSLKALSGLTEAEKNDQVSRLSTQFAGFEKTADGKSYIVYVRDPGVDARNDVGKQLIVLIGTLMTSAVSFYFGSRATAAGAQGKDGSTGGSGGSTGGSGGSTDGSGGSTDGSGSSTSADPAVTSIEPSGGIPTGEASQITIKGSGLAETKSVTIASLETPITATNIKATESSVECTVEPLGDTKPGSYPVTLVVGDKTIAAGSLTMT